MAERVDMSRHILSFTEAVIVIAIVAALAGLLIPAGVMDRRPKGNEFKCTANMHTLAVAMRFYAEHSGDVYPLTDGPAAWKLLCDSRFLDPGIECPVDPFPRAMPGMAESYLYFGGFFADAPPQRDDVLIVERLPHPDGSYGVFSMQGGCSRIIPERPGAAAVLDSVYAGRFDTPYRKAQLEKAKAADAEYLPFLARRRFIRHLYLAGGAAAGAVLLGVAVRLYLWRRKRISARNG